ncbi:phage head completion protein [Macrococcus equi]|uniref:phage head completion protein n=1 Tax=Macrococcus equi TaxID=3395462 RepID=UPI0039BE92DD
MRFKRNKYVNDNISHLDKRVEIYTVTDGSDDGWSTPSEQLLMKVWAEIINDKSFDSLNEIQLGNKTVKKLRIRYQKSIETDMHVIIESERFKITEILGKDSRQPYMYLITERDA